MSKMEAVYKIIIYFKPHTFILVKRIFLNKKETE